MEQQFNRRNGAIVRNFSPRDHVFVRNFNKKRQIHWIPGNIVKRIGNVLYKVQVGDVIWTRHVNHIMRRYSDLPETDEYVHSLPHDIWTGDYPSACANTEDVCPTDTQDTVPSNTPPETSTQTRHSTRSRPPIIRLFLNPKLKSYEEY